MIAQENDESRKWNAWLLVADHEKYSGTGPEFFYYNCKIVEASSQLGDLRNELGETMIQ